MYDLLEIKKNKNNKNRKGNRFFNGILIGAMFLIGTVGGVYLGYAVYSNSASSSAVTSTPAENFEISEETYYPQTIQEQKVIDVVNQSSPSVISIVLKQEVPVYEDSLYNPFGNLFVPQQKQVGTVKKQVGAGTGFIVSEDGLVITNKHVVSETDVEYYAVTIDDEEYEIEILAKDPVQDLAILKIKDGSGFRPLKLGDSSSIVPGQTAIAIGNALGELQNTVSVGVVSGTDRTVIAEGDGIEETLEEMIQTDAAINKGNSGGPLLNLEGEVIGINTAVSLTGENIGFAITINKAKKDLQQVIETGKISYPFLGIRYVMIDEELAQEESLPVDYGALIVVDDEPSVIAGSPAAEAGIQAGSIILEVDGQVLSPKNTLSKIISDYNVGDTIVLKILKNGEESTVNVTLGEWEQEE